MASVFAVIILVVNFTRISIFGFCCCAVWLEIGREQQKRANQNKNWWEIIAFLSVFRSLSSSLLLSIALRFSSKSAHFALMSASYTLFSQKPTIKLKSKRKFKTRKQRERNSIYVKRNINCAWRAMYLVCNYPSYRARYVSCSLFAHCLNTHVHSYSLCGSHSFDTICWPESDFECYCPYCVVHQNFYRKGKEERFLFSFLFWVFVELNWTIDSMAAKRKKKKRSRCRRNDVPCTN